MNSYLQSVGVAVTTCALDLLTTPALAQPGAGWPVGMGPGMMWGFGPGYGMAPGMMGGYGHGYYGMGPGTMAWRSYSGLNLSAEQKAKITQIQQSVRAKYWASMEKMTDAQEKLQELYEADKLDTAAINKQYKELEDLRRQMVDSSVDARNRINGVLTKEQVEKSREWGRGRGPMMWGY